MRVILALVALAAATAWSACGHGYAPGTPEAAAHAQADSLLDTRGPPVGLDRVQRLRFPPLRFDPPEPERFQLSNGATVIYLRDPTLPLIDIFITLKGGYVYEGREYYAASGALLPLMRNGGTATVTADSLNALIDFHALGLSTSTDGSRMSLGISGLSRQLELAVDLWSDILLRPRFDADATERWRVRELEAVRRRVDFPGSLAVVEFNRLFFGDHPNGWIMAESDLSPDRLSVPRLRALHRRVVCPDRAVIGAAGDVSRERLRQALEDAFTGWEPCGDELQPPTPPTLRADPTVYVIHRAIPQSTVVVGQPGGVLMDESPDYFASRVANWVIGGSGFTSRLVSRLRTEEGLAYSAASIWGSARTYERIFGAITHTKTESTVPAARAMLETLSGAREDPPTTEEVELAREAIVNGFVFGFESPVQVVARQVTYESDGLPTDWLERYLAGVRNVDSTAVESVIRRTVHPDAFTILIVGDTTAFDAGELGPVVPLPGTAEGRSAAGPADRPGS
jgi:zinc protease